jgi:hypothetical protein
MQLNVHGLKLAPGAAVDLFDGPFVAGAQLQVLMRNGIIAIGKVVAIESESRVAIELDGEQWWLVRTPDRSLRISSESNVHPEMWEVGGHA